MKIRRQERRKSLMKVRPLSTTTVEVMATTEDFMPIPTQTALKIGGKVLPRASGTSHRHFTAHEGPIRETAPTSPSPLRTKNISTTNLFPHRGIISVLARATQAALGTAILTRHCRHQGQQYHRGGIIILSYHQSSRPRPRPIIGGGHLPLIMVFSPKRPELSLRQLKRPTHNAPLVVHRCWASMYLLLPINGPMVQLCKMA
mmetsp:Transcript_34402/g.101133  ORF Transcript_34402/g.101133 Transcript_34402/m.101133 type:complete len:202 (+) Transcript_34402:3482-4087(+)